jgi:hypothetical protein
MLLPGAGQIRHVIAAGHQLHNQLQTIAVQLLPDDVGRVRAQGRVPQIGLQAIEAQPLGPGDGLIEGA